MERERESLYVYIYIYMYTHIHTHTMYMLLLCLCPLLGWPCLVWRDAKPRARPAGAGPMITIR